MDIQFTPEDLSFQKEVRKFLSENVTDEIRRGYTGGEVDPAIMIKWQKNLA